MLNPPSEEQLEAINALATHNIVINAVAGSGKTTTVLHIAKKFPDEPILLLTYNKRLQLETTARANSCGITNLEIRTYHAFCGAYTGKVCNDDHKMLDILRDHHEDFTVKQYATIIIDESQDITPVFYELISIVLAKQDPSVKLCILGDEKQTIYDYNGANPQYIQRPAEFFGAKLHPSREWRHLKLSTTYRLTRQIADFVNFCAHDYAQSAPLLTAVKDGPKPRYIITRKEIKKIQGEFCVRYNENLIKRELDYYLDYPNNTKPSDIFILAPSIRGGIRNPITGVEELLLNDEKYKPLIYIPKSDDAKLDDDIIKNKIIFASFHQVKGLEREVVIIFGADDSYFDYMARNLADSRVICPNTFYVAFTRAKKHMSIFADVDKPLQFLQNLDIYTSPPITEFNILQKAVNIENQFMTQYKQFLIDAEKSIGKHPQFQIIKYRIEQRIDSAICALKIFEIDYEVLNKSNVIPIRIRLCDNKSVTNYIRHLSLIVTNKLVNYVHETHIYDPADRLDITHKIRLNHAKYGEYWEEVSEITGTAIPIYYEYTIRKNILVLDESDFVKVLGRSVKNRCELLTGAQLATNIKSGIISVNNKSILQIANYLCAAKDGLEFKVHQIPPDKYTWLSPENLQDAMQRFERRFKVAADTTNIRAEVPETRTYHHKPCEIPTEIRGYIDFIYTDESNQTYIYEIKCVQELKIEHKLQLAVYAWLTHDTYPGAKYRLLNIITDEEIELSFSDEELDKIMHLIYCAKQHPYIQQNIVHLPIAQQSAKLVEYAQNCAKCANT